MSSYLRTALLGVFTISFLYSAQAAQDNSSNAPGRSGETPANDRPMPRRVRADDAAIAEDALASFVNRRHGPSKRQVRIDAMHTEVAQRAQRGPTIVTSATIVFRTGLTVPQLTEIVERHGLEVMAIDVKTPYNDIGVIQTIHIGAVDILKWRGEPAEQLEKAIGSYRYKYLQKAEKLEQLFGEETEDSKAFRGMATSEMLIYRCEVFGEAQRIRDATIETKIAAVVPDREEIISGKVSSYQSRKQQTEQRRASRQSQDRPTN